MRRTLSSKEEGPRRNRGLLRKESRKASAKPKRTVAEEGGKASAKPKRTVAEGREKASAKPKRTVAKEKLRQNRGERWLKKEGL